MPNPEEELLLGVSRTITGNRRVHVTYLTRVVKSDLIADKLELGNKLELGIIQTELDVYPPEIQFEFGPSGKFRLYGTKASRPPVVALTMGDVKIEIPADCQLHEIWEGKHFALDTDLTQKIFQQFVDRSEPFPPRLAQLSKFLDEAQSFEPEGINPDWPVFDFEAIDPQGGRIKDIIAATSEAAARSIIEEMGYTVTQFSVSKNPS